jgi:hypothetical protein
VSVLNYYYPLGPELLPQTPLAFGPLGGGYFFLFFLLAQKIILYNSTKKRTDLHKKKHLSTKKKTSSTKKKKTSTKKMAQNEGRGAEAPHYPGRPLRQGCTKRNSALIRRNSKLSSSQEPCLPMSWSCDECLRTPHARPSEGEASPVSHNALLCSFSVLLCCIGYPAPYPY